MVDVSISFIYYFALNDVVNNSVIVICFRDQEQVSNMLLFPSFYMSLFFFVILI